MQFFVCYFLINCECVGSQHCFGESSFRFISALNPKPSCPLLRWNQLVFHPWANLCNSFSRKIVSGIRPNKVSFFQGVNPIHASLGAVQQYNQDLLLANFDFSTCLSCFFLFQCRYKFLISNLQKISEPPNCFMLQLESHINGICSCLLQILAQLRRSTLLQSMSVRN